MKQFTVTIEPRPANGPVRVVFPVLSSTLRAIQRSAENREQHRQAIVKHCVLEFGTGTLEGNIEEGFTFRCDTLEEKPA